MAKLAMHFSLDSSKTHLDSPIMEQAFIFTFSASNFGPNDINVSVTLGRNCRNTARIRILKPFKAVLRIVSKKYKLGQMSTRLHFKFTPASSSFSPLSNLYSVTSCLMPHRIHLYGLCACLISINKLVDLLESGKSLLVVKSLTKPSRASIASPMTDFACFQNAVSLISSLTYEVSIIAR